MFIRVEAMQSKLAGIARRRGLIFVLRSRFSAAPG
jgi:hypothetical protein